MGPFLNSRLFSKLKSSNLDDDNINGSSRAVENRREQRVAHSTLHGNSFRDLPTQSFIVEDFEIGHILGTGSFGRVSLARHKKSGSVCAIKALSKAHIVQNQQVDLVYCICKDSILPAMAIQVAHLRCERDILQGVDHPFIVVLKGSCQDEDCVYLFMEYVSGGEFFTHLRSRGRLREDAARFYAAEVLTMLEHLHSNNIVYRDLKPENLLLDSEGHLKLTDFGFAKCIGSRRTYTLCGTPDYLAPEIILNKGHGKAVDWWAYGVLVYEMMAGVPPFADDDPMGTYKKILRGTVSFPSHFSVTARDLVRKLLQADLSKRYGCLAGGVADIKNHPWFRGTQWDDVEKRKEKPPIRPVVSAADDSSNYEDYSDLPPMHHEFKLSQAEQALFAGF